MLKKSKQTRRNELGFLGVGGSERFSYRRVVYTLQGCDAAVKTLNRWLKRWAEIGQKPENIPIWVLRVRDGQKVMFDTGQAYRAICRGLGIRP